MPIHSRAYAAGGEMFRCAVYNDVGELVRTYGPYSTRRSAAGQRGDVTGLPAGWYAQVESATPVWSMIPGTKVIGKSRGQSE